MKRWFQIYETTDRGVKVWGFSATDDVIDKGFPDLNLVGKLLKDSRNWFINRNCKVIEIKLSKI